ncbi:hypothetical protein S83_047039 [Arachis hypogaea]
MCYKALVTVVTSFGAQVGGKGLYWSLITLEKHYSCRKVCVLSCLHNAFCCIWLVLAREELLSELHTMFAFCEVMRLCETLPFSMHNELFFLNRLIVPDNK